jgi:internalin A
MVPCNCAFCETIDTPHFFDFDLLKRYETNEILNIRCELSLEEVPVYGLTSDIVKKTFNEDKIIICENQNSELLNNINLPKVKFFPEKNSSSVFIKISVNSEYYGLRDRDFLIDSEIIKIRDRYKNYFILDYYCIENYLYHPDNIAELNLINFNKVEYLNEIIKQKNQNKSLIISIYKKSRDSYQEFRIDSDKFKKKDDSEIIKYLESNDLEMFFKSFSMKDYFKKSYIEKYQLSTTELSETEWFKNKMINIIK